MVTWLPAHWVDLNPGARVRRDDGGTGELTGVDREYGNLLLRVALAMDDGQRLEVFVPREGAVQVEVDSPLPSSKQGDPQHGH